MTIHQITNYPVYNAVRFDNNIHWIAIHQLDSIVHTLKELSADFQNWHVFGLKE